jgi:hypothetical protein
MNLAVFRGEAPERVLWQPRLEYWYEYNQAAGTLPAHLRDFSLLDLYDYCHASVRYFTKPLQYRYRTVEVIERWLDDHHHEIVFETPAGRLREVKHYDEQRLSPYPTEYILKSPEDFKVYEYMLQDQEWYWDQAAYERDLQAVGGRGAPQFYFRRSPIQQLFIGQMGFENTVYAMQDYPEVIEHYVAAATEADEPMYRVLCEAPIDILNFGENIDSNMDPPYYWQQHLAPYYRRRHQQLKEAGKFTHIHVDGSMQPLLDDLRDSPFDGLEACTPEPQGDVTLREVKQAVGDRVLLDGIPAVYFLPDYPLETCLDCARQVIDQFAPKLILGVSDELPPDGDIERARLIGELLETSRL